MAVFLASIKYLASIYWDSSCNDWDQVEAPVEDTENTKVCTLELMAMRFVYLRRRLVVLQRNSKTRSFFEEHLQVYYMVELPSRIFQPVVCLFDPPPFKSAIVDRSKARVGFIGCANTGKRSLLNTILNQQTLPEGLNQHKGSIILKASKESSYKVTVKQVPKITAEPGTVLLEGIRNYTLYSIAELHQKLSELLLETFGTTEEIEVEGPFDIPVGLELVDLPDGGNMSTCTHFVVVDDGPTQLHKTI